MVWAIWKIDPTFCPIKLQYSKELGSKHGIVECGLATGGVNSEMFKAFLGEKLASNLQTFNGANPNSVIVIDNKGREAFFSELDSPLSSLHLADSSGNVVDAGSDDWTVGKYYEGNGYQPSQSPQIMYKERTVS